MSFKYRLRKLLKAHEAWCFVGAQPPEDRRAIRKEYLAARRDMMECEYIPIYRPTTYLSDAAFKEVERIIEENKGPSDALLRAAQRSREAIEQGELIHIRSLRVEE